MVDSKICLVGDSTLDNLYWMLCGSNLEKAKQNSIEGLLRRRFKKERVEIVNYAYDGFTTHSLLHGDHIGSVLPFNPDYMNERAPNGERHVSPLKNLQEKISETPDVPHYIVLSIGGNDFRVNLANPLKLIRDIPKIQERYLQIVDQLKHLQGRDIRPILMLQYRTDANHDPYRVYTVMKVIGIAAVMIQLLCLAALAAPVLALLGKISGLTAGIIFACGAFASFSVQKVVPLSLTKELARGKSISMLFKGKLIESFYQPILEEAKLSQIPVLDLTNTFNPYQNLYEYGIEPGIEGGKLIAEGIHHIVKHHDFTGGSILYSKSDGRDTYTSSENKGPKEWHVTYPNSKSQTNMV